MRFLGRSSLGMTDGRTGGLNMVPQYLIEPVYIRKATIHWRGSHTDYTGFAVIYNNAAFDHLVMDLFTLLGKI